MSCRAIRPQPARLLNDEDRRTMGREWDKPCSSPSPGSAARPAPSPPWGRPHPHRRRRPWAGPLAGAREAGSIGPRPAGARRRLVDRGGRPGGPPHRLRLRQQQDIHPPPPHPTANVSVPELRAIRTGRGRAEAGGRVAPARAGSIGPAQPPRGPSSAPHASADSPAAVRAKARRQEEAPEAAERWRGGESREPPASGPTVRVRICVGGWRRGPPGPAPAPAPARAHRGRCSAASARSGP